MQRQNYGIERQLFLELRPNPNSKEEIKIYKFENILIEEKTFIKQSLKRFEPGFDPLKKKVLSIDLLLCLEIDY
jgi:hypothetical protein